MSQLDQAVCERASRSRDPRFDGRFFVAVITTGVYCRPVCPAPFPKRENVRYFASAAAADAAGFRPCLRCRPEAAPGTPAWAGTSALVSRALRLIDDGGLDDGRDLGALAERLGVTGRHLRRLFLRHLGATPGDVAATRRLQFAKKLIDETGLPFSDVAFSAGFGSIRCFNRKIHGTYGRTPSELRALARPERAHAAPHRYRFRLAYRPPYDWAAMLAFLRARATPDVEYVDASTYRRTITFHGLPGMIEVRHAAGGAALELDVRFPNPGALLSIVSRVRQLFDLAADPAAIGAHLGRDPLLAPALARHPGLRAPGAWDGFELAVRAIVGQQISVTAASVTAGRVASLFGAAPWPGRPERLFPSAAQLVAADVERAGVIRAKAQAIRELARRVEAGSLTLDPGADSDATASRTKDIPGVGEWTAQYVVMRACAAPDALPSSDLVLLRAARVRTARDLERRAEAWRPWRAYAAALLWQEAADRADGAPTSTVARSRLRSMASAR